MINNIRRTEVKVLGVFLVVLVVSIGVFFWNLGTGSVTNDDEGIHALVTREIHQRHDWLTLALPWEPYYRKPPVSFWLRAALTGAFGENEWDIRIPSAAAGVGTTMIIALWAWQWTRRRSVMLIAGVLYPLLPSTFVHTFRAGETDGLLIFFLTLAAWLAWRSVQRPWLVVGAGAAIGLAFMTKSVAAAVIPVVVAITFVLHRRWPYHWKHVLWSVVAFLAVGMPWHIYQLVVHGRAFWDEYVGFHIVDRVETRLHTSPKFHGTWWYLRAVGGQMFPWSWLIVPAVAASLARIRRSLDDRFTETFLLVWGIGTVALYTMAATKLAWYVAPAYPAFVLLIARFLPELAKRRERWLLALTAVFALGYLRQAFLTFRTGVAKYIVPTTIGPNRATAVILLVILIVIGVLALRSRRARTQGVLAVAVLLLCHMVAINAIAVTRKIVHPFKHPFHLFRDEIEARDRSQDVYVFDRGQISGPPAFYYLVGPNHRRTVIGLHEDYTALATALETSPGSFLVISEKFVLNSAASSRLSRITSSSSLVLYRISSKPSQ